MSRVTKVEKAIRDIHAVGDYPSALKINKQIGRSPKCGLNSRELVVRGRVFGELGIEVKRRGEHDLVSAETVEEVANTGGEAQDIVNQDAGQYREDEVPAGALDNAAQVALASDAIQ